MSGWNHRVMDHKTYVGIHEVYYDENGEPMSWSKEPDIVADNVEDLRWLLQKMLESLDKPMLENKEEQ